MNIDTTINLGKDRLQKLDDASARLNVSRSKLISSVVRHMSRRPGGKARAWERVEYQERRDKSEWRRIHIGLRIDEYEFFIDLRKVFKVSVSLYISKAIDLYLCEIEALMLGDKDSYQYHNYSMINTIVDGVSCWLFCWGIPTKTITLPPGETA